MWSWAPAGATRSFSELIESNRASRVVIMAYAISLRSVVIYSGPVSGADCRQTNCFQTRLVLSVQMLEHPAPGLRTSELARRPTHLTVLGFTFHQVQDTLG